MIYLQAILKFSSGKEIQRLSGIKKKKRIIRNKVLLEKKLSQVSGYKYIKNTDV